jgi:hypothetical protein
MEYRPRLEPGTWNIRAAPQAKMKIQKKHVERVNRQNAHHGPRHAALLLPWEHGRRRNGGYDMDIIGYGRKCHI